MNASSKPLASLSSTLLARKGSARPAMRRQGVDGFSGGFDLSPMAADDLGWNDMGEPEPVAQADVSPDAEAELPPVLRQREALREELAAPAPAAPEKPLRPVSVATAARIGRETRAKHVANAKSAFTLRLDTDRHLKLRLASAFQNRSAQLLVTEALDAFLETLPELAALVSQLPDRADAKK